MSICQYLGWLCRLQLIGSKGFTPNMLQLGREVNMPADVMLNFSQAEQLSQTQAKYLRALLSRMEEVQHQARQHLRQAQVTQKKYYDLRARANKFSEGDLVYKKNMGCKAGLSRSSGGERRRRELVRRGHGASPPGEPVLQGGGRQCHGKGGDRRCDQCSRR